MPGVPSSKGCDACRRVKKKVQNPRTGVSGVFAKALTSVMNLNHARGVTGCTFPVSAVGSRGLSLRTRRRSYRERQIQSQSGLGL